MAKGKVPAYIKWLLKRCEYPHHADDIELIQTHISYVIVVGDFVYKFKKPINFSFLNFSTLEKRKFYCKQELSLNCRLCPEIYLDLVTVTLDGEFFKLNGSGEVVEYGIKMVRMPEHRMMNRVMEASRLVKGDLDRIIATLIPFYQRVEEDEKIKEFGRSQAVAVNVLENFHQTERFAGGDVLQRSQFEQIKRYSRKILGDENLFEERIATGKIHDCHGDLHSANICLADKVYIFDCIEFNDRLRYSDVVADIAFLAMDLDFHGLEEFSTYFTENFMQGTADNSMHKVLDFYKCYRAFVRGKICLLTIDDPGVDLRTKQRCRVQAVKYFALATHYSEAYES